MANYVNRKELEAEILISLENKVLTDRAVELLLKMVKEIPRQMRYQHEEDKKDVMAEAAFDVLKYWNRYDPTHPKANCFSYYTQLIKCGGAKGWKKISKGKSNTFISLSSNNLNI